MSTLSRTDALRARFHDPDGISGSQKLMILVLSMTLYGVADIVADLVPQWEVGGLQIEVAYFAFIPVALAALLTPFWVALGCAIGEAMIADMLLGSFGGLGEIEGFLQIFVGAYVAGCLVRDPRNRRQLFVAGLALVAIDKVTSGVIDVAKVAIGIDPDAQEEAAEAFGLSDALSTVVVSEGLELLLAMVVTGVVFGGLVAMWLAPRLYGKIEPLMGLRPRDPANPPRLVGPWGVPFWLVGALGILAAAAVGIFSQWEEHFEVANPVTTLAEFEAEGAEEFAESLAWVGGLVGLVVGLGAVVLVAALRARSAAQAESARAEAAADGEDED
ncbi:cell division protein FtsQ [Antribacter gilvus]|uniref:cell division protein FtsQ n=1 Tax=Antribacter gilvus TaxID=2304675 RepID=UPI000F789C47|nr:cell division protein FtsQ [Antribacter gilvus]